MATRSLSSLPKALSTSLLILGLVLLFVAERILSEGTSRTIFLGAGAFAILAGIGRRLHTWLNTKPPVKDVEQRLLWADAGIVIALLVYVLSTDFGIALMGLRGSTAERIDGSLTALWPAILTVALSALLFMEFVYARMPIANGVELRRVQYAARSGLTLSLSLVFLVSINYVASQREIKKDLSYFRTSKPSAGTLKLVKRLYGKPVRVILFFPKVSDVLEQLSPYFAQVDKASAHLQVEIKDHALAPELVKQHRIRGNGFVLLLQGDGKDAKAQSFEVGEDLESARSKLRKLDEHFQQNLTKLTRPARSLHLTVGHREFSNTGQDGDTPLDRTQTLMSLLSRFNIATHSLGAAQGLANEVPADTHAIAILGPREPFLQEEALSLLRFVQKGGRVLLTVDPGVDSGLEPFLNGLGLRMETGVLNSSVHHMRRNFTPADREIVFTNSYSSHPTVTSASSHANEVATLFLRGGALERSLDKSLSPVPNVIFPMRSSAQTWLDLNDNHEQEATEKSAAYNMMAAVSVQGKMSQEGRAVVISDGEFATDQLMRVPGNALVFVDALRWLIGEEEIAASLTSEEDIPIEHTRDEDKLWFYLTAFGVPLPLLGLGIWMARRRRKRSEKSL
ncbi:MAG: Gldg family protein [Myxococcales bacterium]|nr:Gldg family protein [Myxococcales bacterium]MCB9707565.1 Gldg family protein [Myxococcales bacterium]